MKFLTRINRNFIRLFTLVLALFSVSGYLILHAVIIKNTKENLLLREYQIRNQIVSTGSIPNLNPVIDIRQTADSLPILPSFGKIEIWNESENENEIFIEYSNRIKVADKYFDIKLRQSTFENEDLILILALTLFILFLSAFMITYFVTKKLNKTVWADFEQNLHAIESFSLSQNNTISLVESGIDEFERLNRGVGILTEKLKTDYQSLKEFTENASHEIQTPLSIALLNLEEILQNDLPTETLGKVVTSISSLKRLSSLNQSLILLTKIENRQFISDESVNIRELIKYYLNEFGGLFESKKIKTELSESNDFFLLINRHLAGILISNLLSNAVNHNIREGLIKISISEKELIICNTGPESGFTDENIYNRFVTGSTKSYGLGLAIVKKICDTHDLDIHYSVKELHCFTLRLKS